MQLHYAVSPQCVRFWGLPMTVLSSDLEKALDELISNEEGTRFQRRSGLPGYWILEGSVVLNPSWLPS